VSAAGAAIAAGLPVKAESAGTLVIGTPADVLSWDPIARLHSAGMPIYRSVFDSPLIQSPDLKLGPNLITAWKWLDKTGHTLEVTFRSDAVFHNGDPVTTEDFRFTYFERLQADKKLALGAIFRNVFEDIEIKSPTQAIVHFKRVMPTVLDWWGSMNNLIVPKKYFESVGHDVFVQKPIGSGPYKLAEYIRGSRIVLEAFDRYWNGKPKFQRVVFEVIKDASARAASIQTRNVDLADVPIRDAVRLDKIKGLTGEIGLLSSILMVHMKNDGVFKDKNVRLAAHHAVDKAALSRVFYADKAQPIDVPGTRSMPGYPADFHFPYDPKLARELLAKSGYGPKKPAKLNMFSTHGAFANDWDIARALAGMWKKVGIEADLEPIEIAKYYELNYAGKLPEATLWSWANPTNDPELFIGYMLNPKTRFSVWKTPDMGERLAPLLSEPDYKKRIAGYAALNRYAIEQGYTVPILQVAGSMVYKSDINFTWFENGWYEPYRISRK
jgi:peptide/nickel transport system substrate-binding protein